MHLEFIHSKLLQSAKKFKKRQRCHRQNFLTLSRFPYKVYISQSSLKISLLHYWFWSYDDFFYKELDQKFGNRKYPCLRVVQYRDRVKFVIPNLGWMFPIQSYSTLLNSGFTASTVSDLLRENQLASKNTSHLI